MNSKCKECGDPFTLKQEELDWFDKKGFPHPKRCESCRAKRRAQEHVEGKA